MNSALYGNRWTGGDGWYDDDHDTITTNDRGSHDDGCGGGGLFATMVSTTIPQLTSENENR